MNKYIIISVIAIATLSSCKKVNTDTSASTSGEVKNINSNVTDIDGNVYHIIKIGTQFWTVETLQTTHYRNGASIPNISDNSEWEHNTTGAYCNYTNDTVNSNTYGHLYNWYAINNPAGLSPKGWHIPSITEWEVLINYLGGISIAGGSMKATTLWTMPNTGASNNSGLTILPAGGRSQTGIYADISYYSAFWSSSNYNDSTALYQNVNFNNSEIYHYFYSKAAAFSCRCVKD